MSEEIENKKKFKIPEFIKNKYLIVGVGFIIWMLFIDNYSLLEHLSLNKEIKDLENTKVYFQKEINQDKEDIKKLKNDEATEKYAREKYYMKRDKEDIYIIEFDSASSKKAP